MKTQFLHFVFTCSFLLISAHCERGKAFEDRTQLTTMGWPVPMTNEECWKAMPKPMEGAGQPLPSWVRMMAREMPRTAGAFLELDLAQRTASPVPNRLRAAMRWVAATDNQCEYARATAKADAMRAGVTAQEWKSLETKEKSLWSEQERAALDFAHMMTVDSDAYTDAAFASLVQKFDERQVAAMVLLLAYSNFQDRLLNCLGAPLEESGPLAPVQVKFDANAFVSKTTPPPAQTPQVPAATPGIEKDIIVDDSPHTWLPYTQLQDRLSKQRARKTRLRVPAWQEFADRLPVGLMEKPSDIVWYKIAFGYAESLAVPFEIVMRTAGSEVAANWDRTFGNCIFWIVTDAMKCPYCMGHCEMNWEVSGLNSGEIANVSQVLAGDDWSAFTIPQQQALAFARKLTQTPGKVDRGDIDRLRQGFGDQRGFFIAVNASRYNYMTRISNGFQLTLEEGNPFWDYYRMKTPEKSQSGSDPKLTEAVASIDEPRPTPTTRPEMKRLLEDMKNRTERIPLPPLSDSEKSDTDPRSQGYEARLGKRFLPASAGARSYLNFSGSPSNRNWQEPDPALTLDYGFKTRLFWIASRANNCQYCLGHQESKLLAVGMSEDQIAALDSDWSAFSPAEQAAFTLARKLTLEPHLLADVDIENCRKHYTDLQIVEMILSVSGNNAINRWKEGIGVPQSLNGGNFGNGQEEHQTYLTDTSLAYRNKKSKVIFSIAGKAESALIPTVMDRTSSQGRLSAQEGLAQCAKRQARLPLVSDQQARDVLKDFAPSGTVPGWMRVLANFPIAGKRQVSVIVASEKELDLNAMLRARIAWVIARQNGAWYSLSEAQSRLTALGQSRAEIEALENIDHALASGTISEADRSLILVAKNLSASPVVLTDAQVSKAIGLTSAKDVVQTIHYAAIRSLFDRFTEATQLPMDR